MTADPYLRQRLWRPLLPIARIVVALLAVSGLGSAVSLIALVSAGPAEDITAPISELGGATKAMVGSPSAEIQTLSLVVSIATIVMWLVWQHRAHSDLYARRVPGLRYTPGWGVGWWFVPVADLVAPFLCVQEVFAHAGVPAGDDGPRRDARVGMWWATYLGGTVLGLVAAGPILGAIVRSIDARSLDADTEPVVTITAAAVRAARAWGVASRLAAIAAAILAIWVVWTISRREDALEGTDATVPAALVVPPRPDLW